MIHGFWHQGIVLWDYDLKHEPAINQSNLRTSTRKRSNFKVPFNNQGHISTGSAIYGILANDQQRTTRQSFEDRRYDHKQ